MLVELFVVLALVTGDWPQFRGPNADAHADQAQTPLEWSDTQNVVWKVPVPGLGWSSPAVVDNRIYLTTAVKEGEGLALRALALHAANGEVIWNRKLNAYLKPLAFIPRTAMRVLLPS